MESREKSIYVCISTGQMLVNIIGGEHVRKETNISAILLLVTEGFARHEESMRTTLAQHFFQGDHGAVISHAISDDLYARICVDAALVMKEAAGAATAVGGRIFVNLSGGKKQHSNAMLAAAQRASESRAVCAFYVDSVTQMIDFAVPADRPSDRIAPDLLDWRAILRAQNVEIVSQKSKLADWESSGWIEVARKLSSRGQLHGLFKQLSFKATQRSDLSASTDYPQRLEAAVADFLALLERKGLIRERGPAKPGVASVTFSSKLAASYLVGDWLEHFIYQQLSDAGMHSIAINVMARWTVAGDGQKENELDVVGAYANRLLVVECKTAGAEFADPEDMLHRLTVHATQGGGLFGTAVFVTTRQVRPVDMALARRLGVGVVKLTGMGSFGPQLRKWMESGLWPAES
jgi:hypothetical protein